jgi:hypothetical protein
LDEINRSPSRARSSAVRRAVLAAGLSATRRLIFEQAN